MGLRQVVIAAADGSELLDVSGPTSVFSTATALPRARAGSRVVLASPGGRPVHTFGGLVLQAGAALERVRSGDTLLATGPALADLRCHPALVRGMRRLAPRARRVASVCTGAFVLAEAGLLQGRRATTHWAACAELARRSPGTSVEVDPIFVRDGRVWTSAGVTAGIDLALALVEADLGARLALKVARWLVVFVRRPGGQAQYSAPLRAATAAVRPSLRTVVEEAAADPRADLSVESLARRAAMSVRSFARLFRRELGQTPAAWVRSLRLEAARRELEAEAAPLKQVAARTGFGTVEALHRAFRQSLGVTPGEYRDRFARR
jgi:transcriptional regulator GlxA family with amidase domain